MADRAAVSGKPPRHPPVRKLDELEEAMTVSDKTHGASGPKPDSRKEPIVIKKYANRRLYNTDTSTYVTLEDLAVMVRAERDFVVYDAKSSEDLTHTVLTQIIVEQEGRGSSLLPVPFLRQLIRFYGDNMGAFVPSYLQMSMENLTREQEKYRTQFAHMFSGKAFPPVPFGTAAFEALQVQARQNMALFERALGMFTPFPGGQVPPTSANANGSGAETPSAPVAGGKRTGDLPAPGGAELAELKAQMQAMQAKLEKMSGGKS
jgi:polyhydroxyalkanoate synthesis repressor PhaR